jgi:hypothetical protein
VEPSSIVIEGSEGKYDKCVKTTVVGKFLKVSDL